MNNFLFFLFFIFSLIQISEKRLKFNNIKLDKREFHKSKEPIHLLSVELDQRVLSYKFKHNDEGFEYFIGYLENGIVKPLCINMPQMNGYIKYFENGSKNMSFLIKDDEVWDKYKNSIQIWDVIKDKLGIKFHSKPVYEYKYLKAKVREFDGMIKTNFLGNNIPKGNMHYACIACITIDPVLTTDKKNHPQVYLEVYKYRIKKTHLPKFINSELKSDSESSDSYSEKMQAKVDDELEKSGSDSE